MTGPAAAAARGRGGDGRPAVLITGAARGIGQACVLRLTRDGFRVYAGIRREADAEAVIAHSGRGVVPLLLDLPDEQQMRAAVARIDDECGERGLQALVNNAGVAVAGPLEFLPIDQLRRQLEINFTAQIALTQLCLPLLRRSRAGTRADHRCGRVVFMSSISGRSALPFTGAYAASKHALEGAADALRVELKPFGLNVVLVEPGVVATPIWETARELGERNAALGGPLVEEYYGRELDALRRRAARGMNGAPPEHVAEVVSRALTVRRPRARYLVGRDARARALLHRLLPTRARDALIRSVLTRLSE